MQQKHRRPLFQKNEKLFYCYSDYGIKGAVENPACIKSLFQTSSTVKLSCKVCLNSSVFSIFESKFVTF